MLSDSTDDGEVEPHTYAFRHILLSAMASWKPLDDAAFSLFV
jgi:hypothetical protein